ncbi:hypothetical protein BELL_0083g00190 [Botrytis elliptica]|uniref:Uncharacterized protein n=1 Tax=Botrytis elliptica TaxID=278938 RepID=A0A4Z1JWH7_9HELO|nr:hypothetical protein BELL_0083g00190 [Botrytis elliptica]
MTRQANHPKDLPTTHRKSLDGSKAHGAKSKPKTSKVSKTAPTPKQSREQAKKSIVVKPIPKNEFETNSTPESLEEARTHILRAGKAAFEEAHTGLLQKLTKAQTTDQAFLQTITHNAQALSAPLATQKIQMTVQQKGRRVSEIVAIGQRVAQFRQTVEKEEKKLEGYWQEWEGVQSEFKIFATRVFGGERFNEEDADEGYYVDMLLLGAEYTAQMNVLLEELDEVGNELVKKMKASEKTMNDIAM